MPDVFNPWRDHDPVNDGLKKSALIRRNNLLHYLTERSRPDLILVAEAAGYQGCKFSGIAMTSERILLGGGVVEPDQVFRPEPKRCTSNRTIGWSEPTASIVWRALNDFHIDSRRVILWNAFAFHPHPPGVSLKNRRPRQEELEKAKSVLETFVAIYGRTTPMLAVGNVARETLARLGMDVKHIRHPANGGAPRFRAGLRAALNPSG